MALQIDGVVVSNVTIDGAAVGELQIDGVKVWPTLAEMTVGINDVSNAWGFLAGSYGAHTELSDAVVNVHNIAAGFGFGGITFASTPSIGEVELTLLYTSLTDSETFTQVWDSVGSNQWSCQSTELLAYLTAKLGHVLTLTIL